jgi:hypothetical protein
LINAARQNCIVTKAYGPECQPHTTHNTLLARNIQKPLFFRRGCDEVMNAGAEIVATMAGH